MGRFWSFVFLSVPVLGVASMVWAANSTSHWLPRDVSEHGHVIDHLYWFILILTGVVFIATEVTLAVFLWKYDGDHNDQPVKYTHGDHTLEVVWSVLPAATLVFIAVYQMNAWAEAKIFQPEVPPLVEVTGRQFEWRLRYAYTKAHDENGRELPGYVYGSGDVFLVNDLHVPLNEEVVIDLKSADVLHSFFLPNLRVKQDAVPGMKIPVWFKAKEVGTFDLVCAELCGWGHYKMKGRVTVLPRDKFDAWLRQKYQEQEATR